MKLDALRAQAGLFQHIARRDLAKRYVVSFITLFVCHLAGLFHETLAIIGAITVVELATLALFHHAPAPQYLQLRHFIAYFCASVGLTVLYYTPPVLLAWQADTAFFVYAMLYTLGSLVNTSTMFSTLPYFYWGVMIPGFVATTLATIGAVRIDLEPSPPLHWALVFFMLLIYIANLIHALWQNKDTHKELANTRAESLGRLRDLEYLNRFDALTGILNRASFDSDLSRCLENAGPGRPVTVFLIDLDGFKPINDTFGHDAGDEVLKITAQRLSDAVGDTGTAARLGGDEFGVIDPEIETMETALETADRIAAAISRPVQYKGEDLAVCASIGVARSDQTERTVEAICAAADQAMYDAKAQPSVSVMPYDPARFAPRDDPRQKARLKAAIRDREIRPHYQPTYALDTRRLCGFEALARWHDPDRGVLLPGDFLGEAAELGLMGDLTFAMLRQVLADIPQLRGDAFQPFRVSVNIPESLLASEQVCQELDWLISEHRPASECLAFEVTEAVVSARSADAIRKHLSHFSSHGIGIFLDDFGTGYAAVKHLQNLAFEELKIDLSLISKLGEAPEAEHLISGFISIARALGVRATAEGIETNAQESALRRLGCDYGQGRLYGPPKPLEQAVGDIIRAKTDVPGQRANRAGK